MAVSVDVDVVEDGVVDANITTSTTTEATAVAKSNKSRPNHLQSMVVITCLEISGYLRLSRFV